MAVGAGDIELSIVMPCLDEAETLATCIRKARGWLERAGVAGEVVVADNGSTDGSQAIAEAEGARVVPVAAKGYGNALMGGIREARGRYVVMGDADDSYDFSDLDAFLERLRAGDDLVMGNRFRGGIAPGAMPWSHRYIGNPVLSGIGRLFFHAPVGDFHCGLRGFRRDAIVALDLRTTGMEFASEVVVRSCLAGLRISEVPTTLSPDGRTRPPHLRSFRDGWRHLRFLLLYSPRWLFFYPGLVMFAVGLVATTALTIGPVSVGSLQFDVGTLVYAAALTICGYLTVLFALLTKTYAVQEGFLPANRTYRRVQRWLTLERGLAVGAALVAFGLVAAVASFLRWRESGFGNLDPSQTIRTVVPSMLGFVLGLQTLVAALFVSILSIRRSPPVPVGAAEVVVTR
jgi:glycosyltransferase involved in cell wall biosynthesis